MSSKLCFATVALLFATTKAFVGHNPTPAARLATSATSLNAYVPDDLTRTTDITAFAEALKTEVGEEEMAFFTPFLREKVAPYLIQRQGPALAVRLIADMMSTGCTDALDFRRIEAGAGEDYTFETNHGKIAIKWIKVFLQEHCQRKVEISYKKPKSSRAPMTEVVPFNQWTLTGLDKVIRTVVSEYLADMKYTIQTSVGGSSEVDLTDESLQEFLQSGRELLRVTARNEQKGFSLYTELSDALKVCDADVEVLEDVGVSLMFDPYELEPEDETRRRKIGGEIQHAHVTVEKLRLVAPLSTQGLEATTRLYIDPVLLASACIVGDLKLYVEKKIAGRRALGPVDYIFTFEEKIICVTEAKYQKLKEGIAQNVAQMAVVREMRGTVPIFGIATTAKEWVFSSLIDKTLRISNKIENTNDEQLKHVIALVSGLLAAGKAAD